MSKEGIKQLLATLIGLLIVLITAETGYRVYVEGWKPLHRPSRIPGLLWEPTPGAEALRDGIRYTINSQGLRDLEYTREKPEGVFRIAMVGDSVTWGYTKQHATYPHLIEQKLRRLYPDRRYEVLNFGIMGTGSRHHAALVRERVVHYAPDLVILGHTLNDLLDDKRFERIGPATLRFLQYSHFANYLFVKSLSVARNVRAKAGIMTDKKYFQRCRRLYLDQDRLAVLTDHLLEMKGLLEKQGSQFAVVVFPFKQQLGRAGALLPQSNLADICNAEEIPILDPAKELREFDPDKLYRSGDPVHFSAFGNEVLADTIVRFLHAEELI